jgi:hypothetical protein
MKNIIIRVCTIMLLLQSCLTSSKKISKTPMHVMPNFPYRALTKGVLNKNNPPLDTTFDYKVLEHSIHGRLPKNIFNTKAMGTIEFFAMIDTSKHVVDIRVIECEFYKKQNLVYKYMENTSTVLDSNLRKYIINFMQDKPFIQNNPITLSQHPTYCFISFFK